MWSMSLLSNFSCDGKEGDSMAVAMESPSLFDDDNNVGM